MKTRKCFYIGLLALSYLSGCGETSSLISEGKSEITHHSSLEKTSSQEVALSTFEGISFPDATFEYDGEVHFVLCSNVPSFADVVYENNEAVDAGTYQAKATISALGYQKLVLEATLTIVSANFHDISFLDATYEYDGEEKQSSV